MAYFYGSTLASFFAAHAATMSATLVADTVGVGTIHPPSSDSSRLRQTDELPPQQGSETLPEVPSRFVVVDPYADPRKNFEVDFTVDPSRFGVPQGAFGNSGVLPAPAWFAAASKPEEFSVILLRELGRAQGALDSGKDERAFEILLNVFLLATTVEEKWQALIEINCVLDEVFQGLPLDSTTAFRLPPEDPVLRRRYFLFTREFWHFRSRFLLEVLVTQASSPDTIRRLSHWGAELSDRARRFHVDLDGDEASQREQLSENIRHYDRADELMVQEALATQNLQAAEVLLDFLQDTRAKRAHALEAPYEELLRMYRLYRLLSVIYQSASRVVSDQSIDIQTVYEGVSLRSKGYAHQMFVPAPTWEQAVADLLHATEQLAVSDVHEAGELDFVYGVLMGELFSVMRDSGLQYDKKLERMDPLLRGIFSVVEKKLGVEIRGQRFQGPRRNHAKIQELEGLKKEVSWLKKSFSPRIPREEQVVYERQVNAALLQLKLIVVRALRVLQDYENAAAMLLVYIASLPEDDHAGLYAAYRLLEEIADEAGWIDRAADARLRAEAHAQVLRAWGEEVES